MSDPMCLSLCPWSEEPSGPVWSAAQLQVGDWADVKDALGDWSVASVVSATETHVTVRYKGWSDRYNEAIARESPRIAEVREWCVCGCDCDRAACTMLLISRRGCLWHSH